MEYILTKKENHIATITLNRPKKLNAFSAQLFRELTDSVLEFGNDLDTHVILINSACEKAFTAGGDLQEEKALTAENAPDFAHLGQRCMDAIYNCPVPVIMVLHGFALGAAMELIVSADFTIAAENTIIGMPAVNLASICAFGGDAMMARKLGRSRTLELMYTGRNLNAREALELGLIEYVVPTDQLMEKTMEIARKMADCSPGTLMDYKKVINAGVNLPFKEARELETQYFAGRYSTEDRQEALSAFLEKRPHKPYHRTK